MYSCCYNKKVRYLLTHTEDTSHTQTNRQTDTDTDADTDTQTDTHTETHTSTDKTNYEYFTYGITHTLPTQTHGPPTTHIHLHHGGTAHAHTTHFNNNNDNEQQRREEKKMSHPSPSHHPHSYHRLMIIRSIPPRII